MSGLMCSQMVGGDYIHADELWTAGPGGRHHTDNSIIMKVSHLAQRIEHAMTYTECLVRQPIRRLTRPLGTTPSKASTQFGEQSYSFTRAIFQLDIWKRRSYPPKKTSDRHVFHASVRESEPPALPFQRRRVAHDSRLTISRSPLPPPSRMPV